MKIVSFNLRYENNHDGINRFYHRRAMILDRLEAEKPDLIGFQECTPVMYDWLGEHMPGYILLGCGRESDYQGEHNPVAYRRDRYELLSLDVSWLSPTPEIPGSRYEKQSNCPRIITRTTLLEKGASTPFYFFNTHLDNAFEEARVLGAKRIVSLMEEAYRIRPLPIILTGDMNAEPDDMPIQIYKSCVNPGLTDHTEGIPCTFHNFGRENTSHIDYVFTCGFGKAAKTFLWQDEADGIYLSDHYPVAVEFE